MGKFINTFGFDCVHVLVDNVATVQLADERGCKCVAVECFVV